MFRRIVAEQARAVAMQDRRRGDHLCVEQSPARDQPQEKPVVPVRPIHHGRHGKSGPAGAPVAEPSGAALATVAGPGRALWLDPRFGAAGDMILGALIGLGAAADPRFVDDLRRGLAGLGVDGWTLDHQPVMRASLAADRAVVETAETHHHRSVL